jgi:chromosome segregation ATPase
MELEKYTKMLIESLEREIAYREYVIELKLDIDKLKELYEDSREEVRGLNSDLKEVLDQNKALRKRVKDLDCEVYVLESNKELNAKANKRHEHYVQIVSEKDREIADLKNELAFVKEKNSGLLCEKHEALKRVEDFMKKVEVRV